MRFVLICAAVNADKKNVEKSILQELKDRQQVTLDLTLFKSI